MDWANHHDNSKAYGNRLTFTYPHAVDGRHHLLSDREQITRNDGLDKITN